MEMKLNNIKEHGLYDSFMNFKWMILTKDSKCISKWLSNNLLMISRSYILWQTIALNSEPLCDYFGARKEQTATSKATKTFIRNNIQ